MSRHVKRHPAENHDNTEQDGRRQQVPPKKQACPAEDKDYSNRVSQSRNSRQPWNHRYNPVVRARRMTESVRADQCVYTYPNDRQRKEKVIKSLQHKQPRAPTFGLIYCLMARIIHCLTRPRRAAASEWNGRASRNIDGRNAVPQLRIADAHRDDGKHLLRWHR